MKPKTNKTMRLNKNIIMPLLCMLVFTPWVKAQTPTLQWVKQMGGSTSTYNSGTAIAIDEHNNIYSTGYFTNTVDFDPDTGTFNLTSDIKRDLFVQKLDHQGKLVWAKQMKTTGNGNQLPNSITIDPDGNILSTGRFSGTVDFDPDTGSFLLTSIGYDDIYIQKLDADGKLLWAKQIGGSKYDAGNDLVTDSYANVYITGSFGKTVDFDPGPGAYNLTAVGPGSGYYYDVFILKLSSKGVFQWVRQMGGGTSDYGNAITIDAAGNILTTGSFSGTGDFDPGIGVSNLTSSGQNDIFIQKLDSSGRHIWAKQISGIGNELSSCITANTNGDIFIGGTFSHSVDFDPGTDTFLLTALTNSNSIFVEKLDSLGNFIWVRLIEGTKSKSLNSMALDKAGNIYSTGNYLGNVDLDPSDSILSFSSKGQYDVFVQKLDSNGQFEWATSTGSQGYDYSNDIVINSIGDIITVGSFQNTVDFDPGINNYSLTALSDYDIYVRKLGICYPTFGEEVISACDSFTWIDGRTYYHNTDKPTHVISNTRGCDSTVSLNLRIQTLSLDITRINGVLFVDETEANYQWLTCPAYTPINGATDRSFTPTENGDYAVLIGKNNCSDTSECFAMNNVGLKHLLDNSQITIYPNPSNDQVTIDFGEMSKNIKITIMGLDGKLISNHIYQEKSSIAMNINVSPGIYFLQIETENNIQTVRLLISN